MTEPPPRERYLTPHRGAMILVFGILGALGWCSLVIGLMVLIGGVAVG